MGPQKRKKKTEEEKFIMIFSHGLVNFLGRTYTEAIMDNNASDLTAKLLNDFLTVSIKEMKRISAQSPRVEHAQRAIKSLLPQSLFKFASSEAQKELFMTQSMDFEWLTKIKKSKPKTEDKMIELIKRKEKDALANCMILGTEDLLQQTAPQSKFDKNGNKKVSGFMFTLIDEMVERLKENNPANVTVEELQTFVTYFFPPAIAEHAKSEGQRMLFEYETDAFQFEPETIKDSKALLEETSSYRAAQDFQSGLSRITDSIHPDGAIAPKSKKLLCSNLDTLTTKMVNHLKEQTGKKTYKMVDGSIKEIFPKILSEHAIAEGLKMIKRFQAGEYDFDRKPLDGTAASKIHLSRIEAHENFGPGVVALAKSISPKTNFPKNVVSAISEDLGALCDLILSKIKENEGSPTFQDISETAKEVMPRSMAEHAIAEGEKMISLHAMKAITFYPQSKVKLKKRKTEEK